MGRKRELAGNRRPVGDEHVGVENGIGGREIALEVQILLSYLRVALEQRLPTRTIALRVLGMGPDDDTVSVAQQGTEHLVDADIQNGLFLP